MRLLYNIDFELAGISFLILVCIFLKLQYSNGQKRTGLFMQFLMMVLIAELLDIVTAFTISYADLVPVRINMLVNTIYFLCNGICCYQIVRYVTCDVAGRKAAVLNHKVMKILFCLYVFALLLNIPTGILFTFRQNFYQHGILYIFVYLIPALFMLDAVGIIWFYPDCYSKKIRLSCLAYVIVSLILLLIQLLVLPNTLLTFFGISLSALIMAFALETPDYLNLTKLQDSLEEQVREQTLAATERQVKLEQMSFQTVQTLANVIDAKDEYTNGHSERVSNYAALLAQEIGWNAQEVENLKYAAALHDIGKVGVPDAILNKPSRLTAFEYEIIKSHTSMGYDILKNVTTITDADIVARSHHERYDGSGYPDGLKGERIPIAARIVGIADAYDAMNSRRVYRKSLPKEVIREELEKGSGTQFDPKLLQVFLKLLDEGKLVKYEMQSKGVSRGVGKIQKTFRSYAGVQEGYDVLTGLPMRETGIERIRRAMEEEDGCLAFMDVDDMVGISHRMGNTVGDEVIMTVANLLRENEGSTISCRFGGDEFLYYMKGVDEKEAVRQIERIQYSFQKNLQMRPEGDQVTISVGMCMSNPRRGYNEVFLSADKALYYVKHSGKDNYAFFNEEFEDVRYTTSVDLEELMKRLAAGNLEIGARSLDYHEFTQIYEYIRKLNSRYNHGLWLAMITMEEMKGRRLSLEEMEEVMTCMENTIHLVVRNVDLCTRYSNRQYLVTLFGPAREHVSNIMDRILREFYKNYGGDNIQPGYSLAQLEDDTIQNAIKRRKSSS